MSEGQLHELITARWSPYDFADRDVSGEDLVALFDAARWAASSYNEQPWRFIVARRSDSASFEKALSCLSPGNQEWASSVPVLVLTAISTKFERNGKHNRSALHDLGLAVGNLTFEATRRGLVLHQMAGIVPEKIREAYDIPEGFEPATGIAIGYPAEEQPDGRKRKPLSKFVFEDSFGQPAGFAR